MIRFSFILVLISKIIIATMVIAFSSLSVRAQDGDRSTPNQQSPPLLNELESRTDELGFASLVRRSTTEAEEFRRSLLAHDLEANGAHTIARACTTFRKLINKNVENSSDPEAYDLTRFQLDQQGIYDAIVGKHEMQKAGEIYGSFQGKWFGIWDQKRVDHHWDEYTTLKPAQSFEISGSEPVKLLGYQYAWVGDGYGLNHFASSPDGSRKFLLGYVVHIRDRDLKQEVARRPHLGVIDGPDRLIWITKSEIFFEEMIRGETKALDQYYITGFRYSIIQRELVAKNAFQSVYSRNPDKRKPWRGFDVDMRIETRTTGGDTND